MPNNPTDGHTEDTDVLGSSKVVATIPVTDLDRARSFYTNTLGLTALWDNPASVRFGCGDGTELSIFRRGPSTADHTLAHFDVSDIAATIHELEDRGVAFIDYPDGPLQTTNHVATLGPAQAAWFHDPDGNTLGLRQG